MQASRIVSTNAAEPCPARANLLQLAFLRVIAIAGQAATVYITYDFLDIRVPLAPLAGAIVFLALADAATFLRLRHLRLVTEPELFAQILVDVAVLTVLLYFSGGGSNPFASCYLLLVAYGANALPRGFAWGLAAVCIACYAALTRFNVPLPLPASMALEHELIRSAHWVNYSLLAALVAWCGVHLNEVLRQHHRHLEAESEKDARERYLLGLATLAAGTAHEMSTPLSTMSVVVGDLRRGNQPPPDWKRSIDVLWQQLQLCKRSLSDMAHATGVEKFGELESVSAMRFVLNLIDRFRLLRPQVPLKLRGKRMDDAFMLEIDGTLPQAVLSFLNNAADASPHSVELRAGRKNSRLAIQILDRGPGIAPRLRERIGKGPVTTKDPGFGDGAGVLIANSAIERFGGSVRIFDRTNGGTCVEIELPLSRANAETDTGHHELRIAAR
jgi:two-component system sensor histidine kinase RegB